MVNFADRVLRIGRQKESVLVVGLDPNLQYFPDCLQPKSQGIRAIGEAITRFNRLIIDAVHDSVVAVKPQLAYYEIYGSVGIAALEETIQYAKARNLLVIHDAKRGDVGPTAFAYAQAFLDEGPLEGDAVTVNPYLGSDGILPFAELAVKNGKGIFVLVRTSNPSAGQFQDMKLQSQTTLYREIAHYVNLIAKDKVGEGGYSPIGAVVGATYPQDVARLREALPYSLFLVPGVGAQGGKVQDLSGAFDERGEGALISTSRDVIYRYCKETSRWKSLLEEDIFDIISQAVVEVRDAVSGVRKR